MGLFGLNLGVSKNKTKSSGTKTEDTQTQESQYNTSDKSTNTTQNTTGSTTGASATNTVNSTNQQQSEAGTTKASTNSTLFSDPVLSALNDTVSSLIGSTFGGDAGIKTATSDALSFNSDKYVSDIVSAATAKQNESNQISNNLNTSAIGGGTDTNSMAALLADQINRAGVANIAGIEGDAMKTAAAIQQGNITAASGAQTNSQNALTQLASVLKGGQTTGESTTLAETLSNLLGQSTGATTANESQTSQQASTTNTDEILTQILTALTQSNTKTTATEKGSSTGLTGGLKIG